MKSAGYVDWIHICKLRKFGKYICYNLRDIKFFLGVTFWHTLCLVAGNVKIPNNHCEMSAKILTALWACVVSADISQRPMMFHQTTGLFYDLSLPAKRSAFYPHLIVQRNYCHFPVYNTIQYKFTSTSTNKKVYKSTNKKYSLVINNISAVFNFYSSICCFVWGYFVLGQIS